MRDLMRRTVVVAGAAVVLLGPAAGVASAAGGAAAGPRLAAAAQAVPGGTWGTAEQVRHRQRQPELPLHHDSLGVVCLAGQMQRRRG